MAKKSNSKYLLLGAIIIVLALFGMYFFNKNTPKVEKVPDQATSPTQPTATIEKIIDKSLVEEKKFNELNTYATFNVTYPQFKNVSTDFNQKIADIVNAGIENHKKDSGDNWKARYDTKLPGEKISQYPPAADKYPFSVSWEPAQLNSSYISFILIISGFSGGAHGYQNIVSFNYDVKNQKEMTLSDLYPNDPNYLKTVSAIAYKDLYAQFHTRLNIKTKADEQNFKDSVVPMLTAGVVPTAENFSVFTFTPKTITLYFSEYQVAPYAMGQSKVIITRK
ncbi:MAG: DUF3298 domain-containing protein [Candidatus Paceibacterota bacterium]